LIQKHKKKKKGGIDKNWANKFDYLTRQLYKGRTKGILIGPYTSDLASEIILRTIDKEFSRRMENKKKEFLGFRFKDDYVFFTKTNEEADFIRKEMQFVLNEYHLEINENKTKIIRAGEFEDKKTWKADVERLKAEIEDAYMNIDEKRNLELTEKEIRYWLRKTKSLYKDYEDEYIIKTILGSLIKESVVSISIIKNITKSFPFNINPGEVYISTFSYINQLCRKSPSAWPLFMMFVLFCFNGIKDRKNKAPIKLYLFDLINKFLEFEDPFSLIWTLYTLWRCKINIPRFLKNKIIKKNKENWLIMSLIDSKFGICSIGGIDYSIINKERQKMSSPASVISVFGYSSKR